MHEDFTASLDRSSYIHPSTGAVFANIHYELPFSLFLPFRELFNDAPKKLGSQLLQFIIYIKKLSGNEKLAECILQEYFKDTSFSQVHSGYFQNFFSNR